AIITNDSTGIFTDANVRLVTVYDATSLTIGDLDKDNDLDLAISSRDNRSITLLTNNGRGRFKDSFISLEKAPLSITTGDLDRDGDLDLITSNQDSTVTILSNQARGNFISSDIALPDGAINPISIVTADLDKDSDLDLVTANSASNNVTILANNGGVFSGVNIGLAQERSPFSLITADFDRDGYLDLATANSGSNNVSLFLNIHPNSLTPAQTLPFTQDWSNNGLITTNDDWSGVPGIVGYLGQDITTVTGTDPQTLLTESTVANDIDVIANQSSTAITNGGVAEFDGITNRVVALQGSGTADAPAIIIALNTTGFTNVNVAYNLRDVDGTADNAIQPVALQYRVGTSGSFTNVPAGFVADASSGPNLATLVTPVSATLPAAANNQSTVQVRVITSNAAGSDEWIGIDDINITGTSAAQPGSLQFSSATYTVAENGGSATITVTRTNGTSGSVSVNYATSNGIATAGSDYTAATGTLTFANGVTSQTFTVPIIDDLIDEADETVNLTLSNPTGGATLGTPSTALLTIIDNDGQPSLSINDVTVTEGNSGTTLANFTVSLSPASALSVTVDFATANGTATAGSDYVASSGTLTFAPGVTSQTISVTVNGDNTVEPDETFFVNLTNLTNAIIGDSQGLGTITNDDVANAGTLQFSAATYTVAENGGSATITVTRTNGTSGSVSVNYATSNGTATAGSDYTTTNGTLTFADGVASQTFSVPVLDDFLAEVDETVNLALSNPTGATLGTPSTAVLTITNVPKPGTLQFSTATYSVAENGSSATITVTRTNGSEGSVTVDYATSNGTATAGADYTAALGTLTFANSITSQTFTVPVLDDFVAEVDETVNLALSNPTVGATLGTPSTAVLTITNVPKPGTLQFSAATYSVAENGSSATITITRANGSEGSVSVNYATSDGTATAGADYTAASGTLTFANGVTSQTFTVPIVDDLIDEVDETVNLSLSNPTGAILGTPSTALLTITDNDPPASLSINDITVTEASSGTSIATFTVNLTPASALTVMVNFATANGTATAGSDYVASSGTLTFAPGVTSQTVSVIINGDVATELNENFFINLSNPVNAVIGDPQGAGTITNDDFIDHFTIYAADANNNRIQRSFNDGASWSLVGLGAGGGLGQFNA
ncbi:MAG: Endoglucanase, partial [bacterium]